MADELANIKNDIRAILMTEVQNGISLRRVSSDYEEFNGEPLNFAKFGCSNIKQFLMSKCSDVCRLQPDRDFPGQYRAFPISDRDTEHIERMQLRSKKKVRKVARPMSSYRHPSSYHMNSFNRSYATYLSNPQISQNMYSNFMQNMGVKNPAAPKPLMPKPTVNRSRFAAPPPKIVPKKASNPTPTVTSKKKPTPTKIVAHPDVSAFLPPKKNMKKTRATWQVYGSYLLSILSKKKFGMLNSDLESEYEKKFKESLPPDWVDQLEGRLVSIDKNYGNGILLLKALPTPNKPTEDTNHDKGILLLKALTTQNKPTEDTKKSGSNSESVVAPAVPSHKIPEMMRSVSSTTDEGIHSPGMKEDKRELIPPQPSHTPDSPFYSDTESDWSGSGFENMKISFKPGESGRLVSQAAPPDKLKVGDLRLKLNQSRDKAPQVNEQRKAAKISTKLKDSDSRMNPNKEMSDKKIPAILDKTIDISDSPVIDTRSDSSVKKLDDTSDDLTNKNVMKPKNCENSDDSQDMKSDSNRVRKDSSSSDDSVVIVDEIYVSDNDVGDENAGPCKEILDNRVICEQDYEDTSEGRVRKIRFKIPSRVSIRQQQLFLNRKSPREISEVPKTPLRRPKTATINAITEKGDGNDDSVQILESETPLSRYILEPKSRRTIQDRLRKRGVSFIEYNNNQSMPSNNLQTDGNVNGKLSNISSPRHSALSEQARKVQAQPSIFEYAWKKPEKAPIDEVQSSPENELDLEDKFNSYRDSQEIYVSDSSSDESQDLKSDSEYDCICDRPLTMVWCSSCTFCQPGSRVKIRCGDHPTKFSDYDLLVCPECFSENIRELERANF